MSPQQILTTVMTNIVVDKSADNAKPHSLCFLPQYQRQRKFIMVIELSGVQFGLKSYA